MKNSRQLYSITIATYVIIIMNFGSQNPHINAHFSIL